MKKSKSVLNGVISLIISQCIVKVFGLVYKLYLANKQGFGDAGNAIYNSGYQIYALLLTVSSIGVPNAVAKMISEKYHMGDRLEILKIIKSTIVIFSIIGLFFSVILAISADFISDRLLNIKEAKYSIIALAPAIFNVCLISVYRGVCNGTNNVSTTAKSQTIEQIMKTIFTICLVEVTFWITNSNTVVMAAVANFATTLATVCSLLYLIRKNKVDSKKVHIQKKYIVKILKISIPISLSAILAALNKNIDSVTVVRFLKNIVGEKSAKVQYGILSGKVEVLAALPVSFVIAIASTIIPIVSMLNARKDTYKIRNVVNTYLKYTIVFILPCCIGMIAFSDQILKLLFNDNTGSILLKISAISVLFIAVEQIINATLQGVGKVLIPAISLSIGVIVKIFLNILLIKIPSKVFILGGIAGACTSTLICHVVASALGMYFLSRKVKLNLKFFNLVLKPIISSCIMLLCLSYSYFFLKSIITENIAIILSMIVAGIVYITSILILKTFSANELKLFPILSNFAKK